MPAPVKIVLTTSKGDEIVLATPCACKGTGCAKCGGIGLIPTKNVKEINRLLDNKKLMALANEL